MSLTLESILQSAAASKASDIHLIAGAKPKMRVSGKLTSFDAQTLQPQTIESLCYSVVSESQKRRFEDTKELDFTFSIAGVGRFRANYYFQRGSIAAAFRTIPEQIPTLEELNAPIIFGELTKKEKGLILVTGPTGSGKSTTLAAMIDEINQSEQKHIITIEDPIEFYHEHKNSIISQRGVGEDTDNFSTALKYALREDPDVIMVGEMRDIETIRAALTAAETGHLVFATLHTNSATQTINRIINVFPSEEQSLIRTQLSMSLSAVISQILIPKIGGGRVAAHEILINNAAIANLIRDDKIHQIYSQLQLGQSKTGMQTLSQTLINLVRAKTIAQGDALRFATNREEVERAFGVGGSFGGL